jgi:hypothetical protein
VERSNLNGKGTFDMVQFPLRRISPLRLVLTKEFKLPNSTNRMCE